jgi:hypothetical protein
MHSILPSRSSGYLLANAGDAGTGRHAGSPLLSVGDSPQPSLAIRTRNEKFRRALPGHRRIAASRLEHHMLANFTTLV